MDVSKKLIDIKFSNGDFTDFYALSISLTEEISKPYKAVITVLTIKSRGIGEIRKILGAKASVTITQTMDKDSSCSRFLSGVITGYRSRGAVYTGSDFANGAWRKSCLCYELTLEPSLAAAGFVRKRRTFRSLSLTDVVKAIGREYGTDFKETFNKSLEYYSLKDIVFHQHNESDLDFINRLLISYGIDYYFFHSEDSFEPEARLTDSASLSPFSKLLYTNGDTAALTGGRLECGLSPSAVGNGIVRLTGFQVEETSAYGGGFGCRDGELCRYEYNGSLGRGEEIIESKFMENNLTSYFKSLGGRWCGSGGHAALIPGSRLLISGFSLEDKDKLPCVLTGADLFYETPWPADMAIPADGSFDKNGKPLVQSLRGAVEDEGFETAGSIKSSADWDAASEFFAAGAGGGFLLTAATVCDSKGGVSPKGARKIADETNANIPEKFYALPDGGGELAVVVNFVMPVGGESSGLFYFPRIGDRILIQMYGGRYYLLGYLPMASKGSPVHVGAGLKDYLVDRTVLRRRFSESKTSSEVCHELNMPPEISITENVACFIMNGYIDNVVERVIIGDKKGAAGIRKKYEDEQVILGDRIGGGKKVGVYKNLKEACVEIREYVYSAYSVLRERINEYEDACRNYVADGGSKDAAGKRDTTKDDVTKAEKALDGASELLMELAGKVRDALGWGEEKPCSVMGMNTTGDLDLNSGRKMNVYSKDDCSLVAGGGVKVITSGNDGSIELVSKKSIKLSVGPSSISLTPNGITILSRKWARAAGPFDAAIWLDSIRGVSMQGGEVSMSSLYNTSIMDALGGSVSIRGGSVSIGGNTVSAATNPGAAALVNLGTALTECLDQAASISEKTSKEAEEFFRSSADITKNAFYFSHRFSKSIARIEDDVIKRNEKAEVIATGLIPEILNIMVRMIDYIVLFIESDDKDWLTEVDKNGVSNRDAFRLAATCAKLSATLLAMGGLIGKMSLIKGTSIGITKDVNMDTDTLHKLGVRVQEILSPTAGVAMVNNTP